MSGYRLCKPLCARFQGLGEPQPKEISRACLARFRASIEAQGEDGKKAGRKP